MIAAVVCTGCDRPPADEDIDTDNHGTDFHVLPDDILTQVSAEIHPEVSTMLVVRWVQSRDTVSTRIRYTFESDDWLASPKMPRSAGKHSEVLLGIPEKHPVTFYFETETAADTATNPFDGGALDAGLDTPQRFTATTGELPAKIPRPTVSVYDPASSDPARWMLGSVEDTPSKSRYYVGPFWLYIIDRQGRIVWYYTDMGANPCMAYPRVSREESHLYIEKRMFYARGSYRPRVARMTLDFNQFEEISIPGLDDCFDVTDNGGILFNEWSDSEAAWLRERRPDGTVRDIWSCGAWAESIGVTDHAHYCYANTVNWHPKEDTIILSMPYINTAVEIDRQTGDLLSQWGNLPGSFEFQPPSWEFQFNHFPAITEDGTLLVSTHAPGHPDKMTVGEHRFVEYDIDRDEGRLVEKWSMTATPGEWPQFKGEATRLESGNTLVNFGTGGIIKEITPSKDTVWHVKWDADFEDDTFNKMVGHSIMLSDLYPLCRGWR